jgi:hypothetical protein
MNHLKQPSVEEAAINHAWLTVLSLVFKHTLLNHNVPSIQLIKILPEVSFEDYIQCNVQHTHTNNSHTCLLCVWGAENCGH